MAVSASVQVQSGEQNPQESAYPVPTVAYGHSLSRAVISVSDAGL